MVNLGPYITRNNYGRTEYECAYCYKTTTSLTALGQHCRDSAAHSWCCRCERVFPHARALNDHLKYSSSHNVCERDYCDEDFATYDEWARHNVDHHNWCRPCNWFARDQYALTLHDINQHFMCAECGSFFQNDNNRRMHMITHQERDRECYGCTRMFSSFSSMLIHLESGTCFTDRGQLNYVATEYMDSDEYFRGFDTMNPFFCPACQTGFNRLSSLYQHVEMRPDCVHLLCYGECLDGLESYLQDEL
ncbi:C2H2 finger domain-containing protein [Histoplasma capsulatum var. duboisii H88]|uniref:C2H2 finger domain-containing protein n=1 Tax=Ajellomyces capsulatus (strain H88) TaxID=544711 RepID=F0UR14_AJEC8|nr:C2H2 finger domain-containing protein [Histoplasma capsulatum var. duboisii H88]QSS50365.1 C2H2 finger domain-containing protein [Histoplasma capsulatum var. duboisii H88]